MAQLDIPAGRTWKVGRNVITTMFTELYATGGTTGEDITTLQNLQLGSGTTAERPANAVAVTGVAAQGTLTIAEAVTAEDTMTIDTTVYTFKANGTAAAAGEIDLGADEAATKLEIVKAILGTDGYNTAHATVSCAEAFVGDDLVLTALSTGTAGNSIATTETITHASNVFDAATLGTTTAGVTEVTAVGTIGSMYFDTTLAVPIWWCATGWIIAAGTDADA